MRLIDADVLLSQMDNRYIEKEKIVPNTLAEGFMQMDKLINQQDIFDLIEHDSELLDKVAHELKETFNNECPINYTSTQPFFTLENVRTLVDMVIKELKSEVSENAHEP